MNVETTESGAVLKDGEHVGAVVDGAFIPIDGLHPKTAAAVAKRLEDPAAPEAKTEAPERTLEAGDKTPEYVAWFKENHTEAEFAAKYGNRFIG